MTPRTLLNAFAAVAISAAMFGAATTLSLAHHGWGWATGEEFELTGTIKAVKLGNPHGELTLDGAGEFDGQEWVVEIGQPWRNESANLTESMLAAGTELTAHGHRSSNPDVKLMKAEWLLIDGVRHNLYPDRDS